jgi:hypothetical protein
LIAYYKEIDYGQVVCPRTVCPDGLVATTHSVFFGELPLHSPSFVFPLAELVQNVVLLIDAYALIVKSAGIIATAEIMATIAND